MVDARTARYLACADAESLVALHQEMLTSYGFRCFIYATNPIAAEFGKTGHAHDNRILHNCPKTLIAGYVGENLYRVCPIVKWAMSNTGAEPWTHLSSAPPDGTALSRAERELYELFTAHAITAGYTVSLPRRHHAANAEFGLIGAEHITQGALIEIWDEYGADIFAYCHLFHLCATALPVSPHLRILTERQREALELVIKGRTMREIAFAMEINVTTVEKHLRGARDVLQADTTAQAAAKALVLNQIFI